MVSQSTDTLAPTYDLKAGTPNAEQFYREVASLVDEVLELGQPMKDLTQSYVRFSHSRGSRTPCCHEELLLELLTLGVLWIGRGREAVMQSPRQRNLVTQIVRERRVGCEKRRDGSRNELLDYGVPLDFSALQPSLADLLKLGDWLMATGEYDDEVTRIEGWLSFFAHADENPRREPLKLLVTFASAFAARAEHRIGRYTQQVDRFLLQQLPRRRDREAAVQCSRRRVEYHLNLFAAELLNRIWRDEFLACKERVVVLSACLRRRSDNECRAIRSDNALRCSHCTKGCGVSVVTRTAQRYGMTTVAVIHGSDFSQFLRAAQRRGVGTGIVGVACAPGIMGAGLRAKALGLPAQCVVLHASACEHWRTESIPSSFDLGELERLLGGYDRTLSAPSERVQAC